MAFRTYSLRKKIAAIATAAVLMATTATIVFVNVSANNASAELLLSAASGYTIFVEGNFAPAGADTEGKLACGGDFTASVNNYPIGTHYASGTYVGVVGGSITNAVASNGRLIYATTAAKSAYTGNAADITGVADISSVIDFSAAFATLRSVSDALADLPDQHSVVGKDGWQILCSGTDPAINVFTVSVATFNALPHSQLCFDVPDGSYVVLNITGAGTLNFNFDSVKYAGNENAQGATAKSNYLLYNVTDAATVNVNGRKGTLLAPDSDIVGSGGHIEGQLIGKSFTGTTEFGNIVFDGEDVLQDAITANTVVTTTPTVTTSAPTVTTSEPTVTTSAPTVTTSEPTVTTSAPTVTTSEPTVTTSAPTVTTSEPTVTTSAPTVTTSEPTVTTSAPTVTTSEPTVTTSEPTVTTSEPTVTTSAPTVTTSEPTVTTSEPTVTTSELTVTTSEPTVTTSEPTVTTSEPTVTTSEPTVTTSEPTVTTTPTATTTPETTTTAEITTIDPIVTTDDDVTTTTDATSDGDTDGNNDPDSETGDGDSSSDPDGGTSSGGDNSGEDGTARTGLGATMALIAILLSAGIATVAVKSKKHS
ncbi:MAG: choice-of-anchor A family protein [Oscillospiraceae bacterium]